MSFKVNDKVMVVSVMGDSNPELCLNFETIGSNPVRNVVYVVEEVITNTGDSVGLSLVGSTARFIPNGRIVGWDSRQFRKLEEIRQEQDIAKLIEEAKELINLY